MIAQRLLVPGCLLVLAGCGAREAPRPLPPALVDLRAIPDLPIPPGYRPVNTANQVAVSLANGAVRYATLVLEHSNVERGPEGQSAVESWYRERLPALGWSPSAKPQRWERATRNETLSLSTGRQDGVTIITLRLTPHADG